MMFTTEDIAKNSSKSQIEIIQDTAKQIKKNYFQPDTFVFYRLEKLSFISGSSYFEIGISPIKEDISLENNVFLEQGDFVVLANEMFEGTKPLTGEAYDVLVKVWERGLKNTSIIEGML